MDVLRVALWILRYKFGLLDAPRVADQVMRHFRGDREDELRLDCNQWYHEEIRTHIVSQGRATVERHRTAGAVMALVTSSTRYAACPLADELRIPHVLCTELEIDDAGRFTGRITKPMCFGDGKAQRARDWAQSIGLDIGQAYFYTDSITDAPLLSIVANPVAVNPDPRLRRLAKSKTWRIENWQT
jgi:HAD superfamily hydrolase (TIGR01490 family)